MVKEEKIGTIAGLILAVVAAIGIVFQVTYMFIIPIGIGFIMIFIVVVLSLKDELKR